MLARSTSCFRTSLRDKGAEFAHGIEKYADVAAQADHAEALADPVGGGFGSGRQEAGRDTLPVACGDQVIHGLHHARVIELCGNAHGYAEIVVADPGYID